MSESILHLLMLRHVHHEVWITIEASGFYQGVSIPLTTEVRRFIQTRCSQCPAQMPSTHWCTPSRSCYTGTGY